MAIRFTCPAGHRLKVPEEKAGRGMLCPICHVSVVVPGGADSDGVPPVPPPVEEEISIVAGSLRDAGAPPKTVLPGRVQPLPGLTGAEAAPTAGSRRQGPDSIPWEVAAGLMIVIVYSAIPAFGHLRDIPMPFWVRILLGATLLQAVFVLWMLTVRHRAALGVVTVLFASVSIAYAALAAFAFAAGSERRIPWGMEPIRSRAAVWSATVLAVYLLATYFCGAAAASRRRDAEAESQT